MGVVVSFDCPFSYAAAVLFLPFLAECHYWNGLSLSGHVQFPRILGGLPQYTSLLSVVEGMPGEGSASRRQNPMGLRRLRFRLQPTRFGFAAESRFC